MRCGASTVNVWCHFVNLNHHQRINPSSLPLPLSVSLVCSNDYYYLFTSYNSVSHHTWFHHSIQRSVDGYSNACHGRHLRNQGDAPIGETEHIPEIPWNSTDGRSAHTVGHFERFKPISLWSNRWQCSRPGVHDFLTKPVSLESLNKIIEWGSIKAL